MRRLLIPVVVLALALGADFAGAFEAVRPGLLILGSRLLFAVVFLVAWRFRRGRVAWAAALLALVAEVVRGTVPLSESLREIVPHAVLILLPLNLAVVAFLREWPVTSPTGGWWFAALGGEAMLVWLLGQPGEPARSLAERLKAPLLTAAELEVRGLPTGLTMPQKGLLAFVIASLAVAILLRWRRRSIEVGILGAIVAAWIAFLRGPEQTEAYLAVAGLILGLALVENAFSLAFEDGLTGLPARRALEETLRHMGRTYAIAMLDLDHFKKFNDRHGHEIGDQVLQMVAAKLARVSGGGRAFRYGGEEFSVVFPGKSASEAEPFMDSLRRTIADADFVVRSPGRPKKKPKNARGRGGGEKKLKVTVSVGLAERDEKNRLPEEVMKAADKALYRSKKAGRNRVTVGK